MENIAKRIDASLAWNLVASEYRGAVNGSSKVSLKDTMRQLLETLRVTNLCQRSLSEQRTEKTIELLS